MGESTSSTAALIRRIVQLENERDELQRDIETFCIQQSSQTGSIDLLARLQARRVAGLEQELGSCKEKLAHFTKENNNMQEELSQAYNIKGQLADLYKAEIEKNKEVEKEVKFFQSKVATALAERDRAIIEADKVHIREDSVKSQFRELKERMNLMENDYAKQQESCFSLQQTLDELKSNNEIFYQVIEKFWHIRGISIAFIENDASDCLHWKDKATVLLEDIESFWAFGSNHTEDNDACDQADLAELKLKSLEEELAVLRSTTNNLQQKLDKEYEARGNAEDKVSALGAHLSLLKEVLATELRQLQSWHGTIKEAVNIYLQNAGSSLYTLMKMLQETIENSKQASIDQGIIHNIHPDDATKFRKDVSGEDIETCNQNEENEKQLSNTNDIFEEVHFADKAVVENHQNVVTQDNKEAFVQAMQEKVAALLLLSQEEERHHLKENMVKGLEEQICQLNQKLSQVTSEKVRALMEVAQLRQDVQKLQDEGRKLVQLLQPHRSTSASGRLLPAAWTESSSDAQNERIQSTDGNHKELNRSSEGVSKWNWWRSSYTAASLEKSSKTPGSKNNDGIENARLRIENAAMQEYVTNLQHLTKSVHRLAVTLAQVFDNSCDEQAEQSLKAAFDVVEGVASEAQHLKVALSCSLPLSWCGGNSVEPNCPGEEKIHSADTVTKTVADAPVAGIAMVDLLLVTCKIQKVVLEREMKAQLLLVQE